ncbi:MFS transporter [Sporomusa sp.]|uniref:MFS transporter n=1 Tax=Sporomusa sp. TaxID=2078658 RepID=UPI002D045B6D|nr:MFS transporter [Sporomusa sp.]HWR08793.1 MFS transporter [Sporomusa sp.]
MCEIINKRDSSFRWIILLIIFLTHLTLNYLIYQIGGLASQIIPALHLQPSQFAMALSAPMLACAIVGIPAGALADRYGVKNVIAGGLALTVISSFGRISPTSFEVLFVWMFILGFGLAFLNANVAKILGAWFPPRQLGMVMGIYIAGATTGITAALATSALFPSIEKAFTTSAIIALCNLILWLLFVKSKPAGAPDVPVQPLAEYLGVVVKSKNIWFGALAMFFYMGTFVTQSGYLSTALTQAKGINPVLAGLVASFLSLAIMAGAIIGPMISARVGLIRPFLAPTVILGAITSYLAWIVPFGSLTWILLIVTGILLGVSIPLVMSLPISLPEIGPVYAGSAGGLISMLQMAGAFILSSYVIIPLAGPDVDQVFLYISIGYLIYGAILLLLPELGLAGKR